MATVNEVMNEARKLRYQIESFLKLTTYNDYDDLSGLDINRNDPEELFLVDELCTTTEHLADAVRNLKYIDLPIGVTGNLRKNGDGYFEMSGHVYHSGYGIEFLCLDTNVDSKKWITSRVEHDGNDYYIVGYKDIKMQGLNVRIRK